MALHRLHQELASLYHWIGWTADTDLHPDPHVSARILQDAAGALRRTAATLEEAAKRLELPSIRHPSLPAPE